MWHDMSSKAAMFYVPVFSMMSLEWSLHSHALIQSIVISVCFIMWWIFTSACFFTVGNFIDSHANDGRFRRHTPWRIPRIHFSWSPHLWQLCLALLHAMAWLMYQIIAYALAFIGLSVASWISIFFGVGDSNGVWLVFVGAPLLIVSVLRRLGTVFAWFGGHLPAWTPFSPFLSTSPGPWRRHWPIPSV